MAISVLYLWEWPVLHILKLLVNGHNQSMTHTWSTFNCSKLLWWRISAALSHRKEAAVGISRDGSSQTRGSRLLKVTPSDYLTNELWPPSRPVLQFLSLILVQSSLSRKHNNEEPWFWCDEKRYIQADLSISLYLYEGKRINLRIKYWQFE